MNILIVAKFWDASAGIAALRPMKVAKYLLRAGHRVAVICGKEYAELPEPCADLAALRTQKNYLELPAFTYSGLIDKENRIYLRRNAAPKSAAPQAASASSPAEQEEKKQSALNRLKWRVYKTTYNTLKINDTVRCSLRAVKNLPWEPDVILSSYAPEEVHFLAARLKKKYPHAYWIADFRDPMANVAIHKPHEYRYRLKRQQRIFRLADAVSVVSKTWRNEFRDLGAKNAHTVYSGFDKEDFTALTAPQTAPDKLVLTYTGSLYPGLSDLRPLFTAFGELIREGKVDPAKLRFVYAGKHGAEFKKQAQELGADAEIVDHGFVDRSVSLQMLCDSDLLLHALFCFPGMRGIITGKLGEYWEAGKPIVAVITGSERADEFIRILRKSGTGFAYDSTDDSSFAALKAYLLDAYERKLRGEPLAYERNETFIGYFDYASIARRFLEIADGVAPKGEIV